ncbi:MAG TPA: ceramidase domain-containing protein [Hyphomicrobiaceae bacterium]|nr:ceramidase domain-containing protein [Hyphomicrobiaceae bacterium]
MDWHQQIFIYCERAGDPGFWAEPLNAASNAAFLFAAALALAAWLRQPQRGVVECALVALVGAIGVGSFLFHTLATRWAALADTLPITAFMLIYLGYALVRFVGLPRLLGGVLVAAFMLVLQAADAVRCSGGPCLNGSLGYVPALIALGLVGVVLRWRGDAAAPALLWGALIFAISLTFRTVDRMVCPWTAITGGAVGTHFVWHLMNALLLHMLVMAAIRHGQRRRAVRAGQAIAPTEGGAHKDEWSRTWWNR